MPGQRRTQHATDNQPVTLIEGGQTALSPEIQLIRRLQIRNEIRRVIDGLRERVRHLKLIVAAVPLDGAQRQPVIDRAAGGLDDVILQDPRIDRAEYGPNAFVPACRRFTFRERISFTPRFPM